MTVNDHKNVINYNISVFVSEDDMAPLTCHCEALPIMKKKVFLLKYIS